MRVSIHPQTPYTSMCKEPNGKYIAGGIIGHNATTIAYGFTEDEIPEVIKRVKKYLECFKGSHIISVNKLVWCESFVHNSMTGKTEMRNWKVIPDTISRVEMTVDNPIPAKITAEQGNSFGTRGWFLKVDFGIEGIFLHDLGIACSSYKSAKEHVDWFLKGNEEISHWEFVDRRKKRMVKCNGCDKKIDNLSAEQCSNCGRYFCSDCLTGSECGDCENED